MVLDWVDGGGQVDATCVDLNGTASGKTLLMFAARCGDEKLVEALLKRCAEVDKQDSLGCTALMNAAGNGHGGVADLLLQHGADVNLQDELGFTALMTAALCNRPTVVQRLLRAGADMAARSLNDVTALHIAKGEGQPECIDAFKKHLEEVAAASRRDESPELDSLPGDAMKLKALRELLPANGAAALPTVEHGASSAGPSPQSVSGAPHKIVDGYQLGPNGWPIMRADGSFVRATAAAVAAPASAAPAPPTTRPTDIPYTAEAAAALTAAIENTKMLAARTMGAGPLGQLPGGSIAPPLAAPTPAYDGKFRAAKAAFKAYVVYFNAHPEARERLGVRPHADYEGKADAAAAVRATRAEARAALNTLTGMWKTLEVSAPPAQLLKALHAMKELHQDGHLNCQDPAMGGEDTAEGRLWGVYRKAAQDLRIDMQVQVPVPAQTLSLAAAEQLEELVRIASLSPANGDAAAPSSSGAPSCSQLELVAVYPNLSEEDPILLTKDDLVRESRGFEP